MSLYDTEDAAYEAYRQSPKSFFEKYHRRYFSEKDLISPDWKPYESKYHYNLVENGIIDVLLETGHDMTGNVVLDVGSGTGHWIDFYLGVLDAAEVVGIDFSEIAIEELKKRYADVDCVNVECRSVGLFHDPFKERFDVINAIGVMFHIIDDNEWRVTVGNLCRYLKKGGLAIVGGEFGSVTEELGVMRKVRSLDLWKSTLAACGARIVALKRFEWFKNVARRGLKDNLLAFAAAEKSDHPMGPGRT